LSRARLAFYKVQGVRRVAWLPKPMRRGYRFFI